MVDLGLGALYGETFAALVKGMQGALWELGGVPEVVRTDNLSAATHELKTQDRLDNILSLSFYNRSRRMRGENHELSDRRPPIRDCMAPARPG